MPRKRKYKPIPYLEPDHEGDYTVEHYTQDGSYYGAFVTFSDGRKAYFAARSDPGEIYRGGGKFKSLSEGMRAGRAGWAIDKRTILLLQARGVKYLGVMVWGSYRVYVTHLSRWIKAGEPWYALDYTEKGGSDQKVMPLQHFKLKAGESLSLR